MVAPQYVCRFYLLFALAEPVAVAVAVAVAVVAVAVAVAVGLEAVAVAHGRVCCSAEVVS